jgi:hypothetical protein
MLARPSQIPDQRESEFIQSIRNQPIEAVDNNELNLALLRFEIQTELLPNRGKYRIRGAIGCW